MQEDLNQLCIYKLSPEDWWVYLETFDQKCFKKNGKSDIAASQCTEESLKATKITKE